MVSEEGYEDERNEGDECNESYEGYWADDQNWNEGCWTYEDLYYLDGYGYFQKKGKEKDKERKARKARLMKAKEEHQEMEKENPAMFNFRPHQLLLCRINNNKLITLQQHQAQGMVFLHLLRLTLHVWMFDSHP
jgi:hypothetical protein